MDVAHSCRCCLRRAPDKDLTTPYTHLGNMEIYSDMLKECFEIHLILDSEADVGICDVCVGRLRDASDFKLQVQRSQIELHAWLQETLQVKEEKQAVGPVTEDGDGSSEEPVSCEGAPIKSELDTEDGTNDEERQELSYEERAGAAEAEVSEDEEEDCISLVWPEANADLEPARPVSARAREQLGMACAVRLERLRGDEAPHASQTCLATSRRGPRLASRMKDTPDDTADEQAYTCDTCGEHFTDKSRLIEHIQEHMGSKRDGCRRARYTCDTCGKHFTDKSRLIKHIQEHAPNKSPSKKSHNKIICDVCNKQLANKRNLDVHKRIHTGEKPFACGFCDKRFTQLSVLNAHTPQHTGERRYRCKICNKRFTRSYTLQKHEKRHKDEEKPFKCEECDKKFRLMYYLLAHKRTHVRPYGCDICDKRYPTKYFLALHMEAHTGNKRYSCQVCNKRFSYSNDVKKHEVTHTRKKPYACDVCDERFRHKATLKRHIFLHTGQKPFSCKVCHRAYPSRGILNEHLKTHSEK